jgi:hypothetical protein
MEKWVIHFQLHIGGLKMSILNLLIDNESFKFPEEFYCNTEPQIVVRSYTLTLKVVNEETGKGLANIPVYIVKGEQKVCMFKTNHRGNLYNIPLHAGHYTIEYGDKLQNDESFTLTVNAPNYTGYRPELCTVTNIFTMRQKESWLIFLAQKAS